MLAMSASVSFALFCFFFTWTKLIAFLTWTLLIVLLIMPVIREKIFSKLMAQRYSAHKGCVAHVEKSQCHIDIADFQKKNEDLQNL